MYVRYYNGSYPTLYVELIEYEDYVTPQKLIWAPTTDTAQTWVALIYESNIWLVNPFTGIYNQITIDQSVTKMIWE